MNETLLDALDRAKNDVARAVADAIVQDLRQHGLQVGERLEEMLHRTIVVRLTVEIR